MLPRTDQYAAKRGLVAVRDNLPVRFLKVWSFIGAIEISGDAIARSKKGSRS